MIKCDSISEGLPRVGASIVKVCAGSSKTELIVRKNKYYRRKDSHRNIRKMNA